LSQVVEGGKHPVEAAFRPRISLQNLGDGLVDGVFGQGFGAILGCAVHIRLSREPIPAGLLIKVSRAQLQLTQRLPENGKLIAGLDAG
jgi:hypothetical protein